MHFLPLSLPACLQREADLLEPPQREALAAMLADHTDFPAAAAAAAAAAAGTAGGASDVGAGGLVPPRIAGTPGAGDSLRQHHQREQQQLVSAFRGWQGGGGPAWENTALLPCR